jgi:Histidinol dehydrogenase
MNVVPAQVAGVASIALASPPQKSFGGGVHPVILGAAGLLGIDEVYAIGGAGAIGALAWGVEDIGLAPVQVITGPGNIFVAAAKRVVRGQTGIDSEAGTTEILIIADASADARLVAADLVSQAEHDEAAAAILVTDSPQLAERVQAEAAALAAQTRHGERVGTALGGPQSALVLVDDLPAAAAFSDAYGPEHLEIQTSDPDAVLALIHDAGAIFLGPLFAREPGRLHGRFQPRAADGGAGAVLVGTRRILLPARAAGGAIRSRRAGSRRRSHRRALGRRRPARARRGRHRPLPGLIPTVTGASSLAHTISAPVPPHFAEP